MHDAAGKQPGFDYFLLRMFIFMLIGLGVLMAYSASMATSAADGSVWQQALRQTIMVLGGLFLFWIALRTPPRMVRRLVMPLFWFTLLLLVLVLTPLGTGREEVGSQSWIVVAGISIQPSELARISAGLLGAYLLAGKKFDGRNLRHWRTAMQDPFVHYAFASSIMFALIFLQGDAGMAMAFGLVVAATLFFAGADLRVFAIIAVFAVLGVAVLVSQPGYRAHRFKTYFDALVGDISDTQGTGFQSYQGFLSLADGGFFGVGPGQSRAKWFYLPEAKNDFVFAILGEELGVWGGCLVIAIFASLGYIGIRTALRAQDQFQALAAATLTAGVVSQAFFNIGYVIGLFPVTGIQLPMISSGGTAALLTIGSMGILCNIARHEPEQVSAMQNYGRPLFDRILFIPEPKPADWKPRQGGHRRQDPSPRMRIGQPVTARRVPPSNPRRGERRR